MGSNTSLWRCAIATGANTNLMTWTDSPNNTGTGVLARFTTAAGSSLAPWQPDSNGVGYQIVTDGALRHFGQIIAGKVTLQRAPVVQEPQCIAWKAPHPANSASPHPRIGFLEFPMTGCPYGGSSMDDHR